MFKVLSVALLLMVSVGTAWSAKAQDYQRLLNNFDARTLTHDDKKFLQVALAFEGDYVGLLDGDWGKLSQRAMHAYSRRQFGTDASDWHQAMLAFSYFQRISEEGWNLRYIDALGVSLLLPDDALRIEEATDNFSNWQHTNSSLSYSASVTSQEKTQGFHDFTNRFHEAAQPPYVVRKPNFAVTSARKANGETLYTRSDFINGRWTTVMLSADRRDANILSAVSASITVGRSRNLTFTDGGNLHRAMLDLLDAYEQESKPDSVDHASGQNGTDDRSAGSAGSGFIVSRSGHVLTNAHVVEGCRRIVVNSQVAELRAVSEDFDLALLETTVPKLAAVAQFSNRPAKLNSDVTVAGYPYSGALGGLNVTRGAVASLKGLGGDAKQMQISAPVQSGNSGGPVIGPDGSVVGVVVSKLNAQHVANATGDLPQNVNFAVRGEIAKLFLSQHGVDPSVSERSNRLAPTDLADRASSFTVFIECE